MTKLTRFSLVDAVEDNIAKRDKRGRPRRGDESTKILVTETRARTTQQQYSDRERAAANRRRQEERDYQSGRSFIQDGLDHINLWVNGATELGKLLSPDFAYFFELEPFGEFSSINALWTWLTTKDHPEILKKAPSYRLRAAVRARRENGLEIDFPNAEFICATAIARFINAHPQVADALVETKNVPILCYIVQENSFNIPHSFAGWWTEVISSIRSDLVDGVPVNVDRFCKVGDPRDAFSPIAQPRSGLLGSVAGFEKEFLHRSAKSSQKPAQPSVAKHQRANRYHSQQPEQDDGGVKPVTLLTFSFFSEEERKDGIDVILKMTKNQLRNTCVDLLSGLEKDPNAVGTVGEGEGSPRHMLTIIVTESWSLVDRWSWMDDRENTDAPLPLVRDLAMCALSELRPNGTFGIMKSTETADAEGPGELEKFDNSSLFGTFGKEGEFFEDRLTEVASQGVSESEVDSRLNTGDAEFAAEIKPINDRLASGAIEGFSEMAATLEAYCDDDVVVSVASETATDEPEVELTLPASVSATTAGLPEISEESVSVVIEVGESAATAQDVQDEPDDELIETVGEVDLSAAAENDSAPASVEMLGQLVQLYRRT